MKLSALVICLLLPLHMLWAAQADTLLLQQHILKLVSGESHRNSQNIQELNQAADYIKSEFEKLNGQTTEQTYAVDGQTYRNIILSNGPEAAPVLVIGAHYDVCGNQPGADDNASGVAGMLELARMLQNHTLPFRLEFVAYTLEEPPYFRTDNMGSYMHAEHLAKQKTPVLGMVSLEMIGYFKDEKRSQQYPIAPMKLFYGSKGNYIAVVQRFGNGKFGRNFLRTFNRQAKIPVKSLKAPAAIPGVDFSDHLNYWRFGYSALMITDTSFYRNANYHQPTDTIYTLDFERMKQVVNGVYQTILLLRH